jgi:hypothetical protein
MSTDETELTFIRCPNCRSLVPAVATRCRMCGHTFEDKEAAGSADPNQSGKRRRVRQKSMWENTAEAPEEKSDSQSRSAIQSSNLRAPIFAEPDVELVEEVVEEEVAEVEESFESEAHARYSVAEEEPTEVFAEIEAEPELEPEPEPAPPQTYAARRGASLLFSNEESSEEEVEEVAVAAPTTPSRREERESYESKPQRQNQPVREERAMEAYHERRVSNGAARSSISRPIVGEEGALLGWFVNFDEDARGIATEIHEGRFIIGQERLRDTDMVIDHPSLSTPHCIISASREKGFRVQDLMSESGTMVKKHNSDKYIQDAGPMPLEHGDWLKLGEYEVMVCLIPLGKGTPAK